MTNRVSTSRHLSGSSLLAIITLSGTILLLLGTLFSYASVSQAQVLRENFSRQAVTLGNGGLNHALVRYRLASTYQSESYAATTGAVDIQVTPGDNGTAVINAQAYVPAKNLARAICRPFQITVNEDGTLVPQSYRELPPCSPNSPTNGENTPPVLSLHQPEAEGVTAVAGAAYDVVYSLTDTNPTDVVKAKFFYTPNNTLAAAKTALTGACGQAPTGSFTSCTWFIPHDTEPGEYFLYGEATDNVNGAVTAYSPQKLRILAYGTPDFQVTTPNTAAAEVITVGQTHTFTYSLIDTAGDQTVTAQFAYDPDSDETNNNHTAIDGCASQPEAAIGSCQWTTTGVPAGTYYIRGTTSGSTHNVTDFSPGTVVITTNSAPSLTVLDPSGEPSSLNEEGKYAPRFVVTDDDISGDNLSLTFYADTDATGYNGTSLPTDPTSNPHDCVALTAPTLVSGQEGECEWDTTTLQPGIYYLYGIISNDEHNRIVKAYSPGYIYIPSPPVDARPALSLSEPDGVNDAVAKKATCCETYTFIYSLSDAEQTVTADFYYSTQSNWNGTSAPTAITTCQDLPEATASPCNWQIPTNLPPGNYYIHGVSTDDENTISRTVQALSPGTIHVTTAPVCSDASDNDGDGATDYPSDVGCTSATDTDEKDPPNDDTAQAVILDSNDNSYVFGSSSNGITRTAFIRKYTTNGVLCNGVGACASWGTNGSGMITYSHSSKTAAFRSGGFDSSGNLYVAGLVGNNSYQWLIQKYSPSGALDTAFGTNGSIIEPSQSWSNRPEAIAVASNGHIFVTGRYGTSNWLTRKYDNLGRLCNGTSGCSNWATNGVHTVVTGEFPPSFKKSTLDDQGNLYLAGEENNNNVREWYITKLTTAGGTDTSFGTSGAVRYKHNSFGNTTVSDIAIDSQSNLYVAGSGPRPSGFFAHWVIRKYASNGTLCNGEGDCAGWGESGSGTITYTPPDNGYSQHAVVAGITLDGDQEIYVTGNESGNTFKIRKYTPGGLPCDGSNGCSWGIDGSGWTYDPQGGDGYNLDATENGKIVTAGSQTFSSYKGIDMIFRIYSTNGLVTVRQNYDSTL